MFPDSQLAREIADFVRDTLNETLFHHSVRVYLWGVMRGEANSVSFDPELLYAAAMFHDIGLTDVYRQCQLRFEVDGANAAREFLLRRGIAAQNVRSSGRQSRFILRQAFRSICMLKLH